MMRPTKERLHTVVLSKEAAMQLYHREFFMYKDAARVAYKLPGGKEMNAWDIATAQEAARRRLEMAESPENSFAVEMFYDRPKEIINFHNRLCGDDLL